MKRLGALVFLLRLAALSAQTPKQPQGWCEQKNDYRAVIESMIGELRRSLLAVSQMERPGKIDSGLASDLARSSVASLANTLALRSAYSNRCETLTKDTYDQELSANSDFAGLFEITTSMESFPVDPEAGPKLLELRRSVNFQKLTAGRGLPFHSVVRLKLQAILREAEDNSPYAVAASELLGDPPFDWQEQKVTPTATIPVNPKDPLSNQEWKITLSRVDSHKKEPVSLLHELRGYYLFSKAPQRTPPSLLQ